MTQDPEPLLAMLIEAETAVWEALRRGDANADAAALSEDFVGVYPDGIHGKATHVAQLAGGPTVSDYWIDAARALAAGECHGLLVYRARYRRPGADAIEEMHVSSLWRRHGSGWINIFSQDTPTDTGRTVP